MKVAWLLAAFIAIVTYTAQLTCSGATVANSRKTNKQPQLQKQAQNKPNIFLMIYYHQYYLLSIIYYQ